MFQQLLGTADVVVSNLAPEALARWRLESATCGGRGERSLIVCGISG
ncbi:CoA transferase [Kyrpidia sp.]|nr:CoA transferase [Kyrpidia sp.]